MIEFNSSKDDPLLYHAVVNTAERLLNRIPLHKIGDKVRQKQSLFNEINDYRRILDQVDFLAFLQHMRSMPFYRLFVADSRMSHLGFPLFETSYTKSQMDSQRCAKLYSKMQTIQPENIIFSQSRASMLPYLVGRGIFEQRLQQPEKLSIMDLCGAPGNKTLNYAHLCFSSGTQITSIINDASGQRLQRVAERLETFQFKSLPNSSYFRRIGDGSIEIRLTQRDARDYQKLQLLASDEFDIVLADVPCPGDGRIHTDPGSAGQRRYRSMSDVQLQTQILESAVHLVNPRGAVIYSTCSINPIVDEGVVTAVLHQNASQCIDPQPYLDPNIYPQLRYPLWGAEGIFESHPDLHGIRTYPQLLDEGFFLSVLTKK